MKVGDLVRFCHESRGEENSLPIGIVVKINQEASSTGEGFWCSMLWDDCTVSGAWIDELKVINERR